MLVSSLISLAVAVGFFSLCSKWPRVARMVPPLFFFSASLVNSFGVLYDCQLNAPGYGPAIIELCRQFIQGPFAENPAILTSHVAAGQFTIAVLALMKGFYWKLGLAGAMVYLVAITPLSTASAIPAPVIMIAGLVVLYRNASSAPHPQSKEDMKQPQRLLPFHTEG